MQFHRIVFALALLLSAAIAHGQVATGAYPFGTFDTPGIDTINVGNLNVHLSLAVLNKAGRGTPFNYNITYDNSVWMPVGSGAESVWEPVANWGWSGATQATTGYMADDFTNAYCYTVVKSAGGRTMEVTGETTTISDYVYHDQWGISHPFSGSLVDETGTCGDFYSYTVSTLAADGSGYQFVNGVVTAPQNNRYTATYAQDNNGNLITVAYNTANNSYQFTDTTGNAALTVIPNGSTEVLTYTDTAGTPRNVTVSYGTYTVQTNFGCGNVSEYGPVQTSLVSSISYPDGSTYNFTYEPTPGFPGNVTGRLASVQQPQGGTISYTYTGGNNGIECADGSAAGMTRSMNSDSGSAASAWTYARSFPNGGRTGHTEAVDGLGNYKEYDFVEVPSADLNGTTAAYYETNRSVYQGAASGAPVVSRQTCYNASAMPCTTAALAPPFAQIDTYNTLNGIQMAGSTAYYNAYAALTGAQTYDFGGASNRGAVLKNEVLTYGGSIASLPTQDEIFDGSGNEAGNTTYAYDTAALTASSGVPQLAAVSGPRGNPTAIAQYASASTAYTTSLTYEDTGSVLTVTPPTGTTVLSYDPTFTYLTGTTLPTPSSGVALSASASYDASYTGLPLSATDANGQVARMSAYDSMLRPTQQIDPDGGVTTWSYTPTLATVYSYQSPSIASETVTQYDGYGRLSRTYVANGQSGNACYQQDTCYDANGNASFVSYRYRGSCFAASKVCSGAGTTYAHDVLGRLTSAVESDGEARATSYFGRAKQTVDELGVTRISLVDGLGRKTVVCEISSNASMPGSGSPGNCGTDIAGTGFTTTYSYALATGTTTVNQGGQTRVFQSDWLGRPVSVTEPESGTTNYSYAYNATGLQVVRTRPRANQTNPSVTTATTYQYDALNRIVSTTYNDGTPTKLYVYDQNGDWGGAFAQNNLKGRLSEDYVGGADTIYSYDAMGRVGMMGECTPQNCGVSGYPLNYSYDWEGNLLTATDGAGRTTSYTYSLANEVQSITSSLSGSTYPPNLVSNVQNGPFGPVSWQLGNGLSAVRLYDFKGRIAGNWVCEGTAQTGCPGGVVYGSVEAWTGSYLTAMCDQELGQCSNYGYDGFGRLASTVVYAGPGNNFTYAYDRWGNRWQQNVTSGSGPQPQLSFNTSNNHIANAGYAYDAAGNLISDGLSTYSYDADGNLIQENGAVTTQFVYDALNHRVQENNGGNLTEFVFNASGQRVSIWNGANGAQIQGQNYWGKHPVEFYAYGWAHFQHQDWIGTERATTNYAGGVEDTYTSLPFGDGYSAANGADYDNYHFAMLDHDYNTNTDHAQFRQYGNVAGRWMSPDRYSGSYHFGNPQSFNRYAYVKNNPLSRTDRWGLEDDDDGGNSDGMESGAADAGDAGAAGAAAGAAGAADAAAGAAAGDGSAADAGSSMGDAGASAGAGDGNPVVPGETITVNADVDDSNSCDPSQNPFCANIISVSASTIMGMGMGANTAGSGGGAPSGEPSAACIDAKAHLAEVAAHDRESTHAFYKEVGAGAGIGCVWGVVFTDTVTLGGGIPFFAGECAAGGIGGGITAVGVYGVTNFGTLTSNTVADVQAIANVVKSCQ